MGEEIIIFGNIEIEKHNFTTQKLYFDTRCKQ